MEIKKEAKKLNVPTGKISKSYLGINDLIAEVNEEKIVYENESESVELQNFSSDELVMAWRKFAFNAKENNLEALHSTMVVKDPVIGDNFEIIYSVISDVQAEFIKKHEINLLNYLRKELKNTAIRLNIIVETSQEIQNIGFLSDEDIFEDMAKINPMLNELRKNFNLDIDI